MAPKLSILTPAAPGAIAVLQLWAPEAAALEAPLIRTSTPVPESHRVRVGRIAGVDEGVIARWSPTTIHLMPHAGPAVVAEITRRLQAAGAQLARPADLDPRTLYPEAADLLEARMLAALSTAASPLAIDLLLDQPRRWRAADKATRGVPLVAALGDQCSSREPLTPRDTILSRLLTPPLIAAYGPANIGKSTLCNALAGRSVSIVADEPGTTRDHVGVMLELGGLAVRYVDTPGMAGASSADPTGAPGGPPVAAGAFAGGDVNNLGTRSPPHDASRPSAPAPERDAVAITLTMLRSADLILRCGDAASPPLSLPPGIAPHAGTIDVALRTDLGTPTFARDIDTAAATGRGIDDLAVAIRERLVPRDVLDDGQPWAFWTACPASDAV